MSNIVKKEYDNKLIDFLKVPEVKKRLLPVIKQFELMIGVNPIYATSEQITQYFDEIRGIHKATTYNYKLSMLKKIQNLAVEFNLIEHSNVDYLCKKNVLKSIKIENSHSRNVSIYDIKKFIKSDLVPNYVKAYVELIASTGLRTSAALRIKRKDIITVEQVILDEEGRDTGKMSVFYNIEVIEKRLKQRKIPVTYDIMTRILKNCENDRINPLNFLFISRKGQKSITRQGMFFQINKYWQLLFGRNIKSHDFRHFFADWHLGHGRNLIEIKEMLGHANLTTTEIYVSSKVSADSFNIDLTANHKPITAKRTERADTITEELDDDQESDDILQELDALANNCFGKTDSLNQIKEEK